MSVLLLGGPTAAGKSDLAVELAQEHDAAVVSADAMTVYRGLDVGTAKPSADVLMVVPHACVDVRELHESFDVMDFVAAVDAAVETHGRVVVVGGTPFYLQALVRPLAALPAGDASVRARFEAYEDPHAVLAEVDPDSARRLHPNDRVRVVRALEVHAMTGRTLTELHAEGPRRPPLDATVAWLDRSDLQERIGLRLQNMRGMGYVEETRWALDQDQGRDSRPLRSFAYRHLVNHVDGEIGLDEAIQRTARDTWRFARKQRTWARGLGWSSVSPAAARSLAAAALRGR